MIMFTGGIQQPLSPCLECFVHVDMIFLDPVTPGYATVGPWNQMRSTLKFESLRSANYSPQDLACVGTMTKSTNSQTAGCVGKSCVGHLGACAWRRSAWCCCARTGAEHLALWAAGMPVPKVLPTSGDELSHGPLFTLRLIAGGWRAGPHFIPLKARMNMIYPTGIEHQVRGIIALD